MKQRSDIDRVLEVWMSDGPTAIPDRVVDVVAARIGVQRQRRTWPFQRRTTVTPLKLSAGAAAVLVVVVGYNLLSPQAGVGGPRPSPVVTSAVPPAPSASAVFPPWWETDRADGAGILPAGTGTTRSFVPGSTFRVPAGWVNGLDMAELYELFQDTPANEAQFSLYRVPAQGIFMGTLDGIYVGTVDNYWANCIRSAGGSTSVDSLVANEALVTSEPVDVAIGGLTGTRVDGRVDPDWTGCSPEDKDHRGRFIFLDTPDGGRIWIIVVSVRSADFEAFLAEAMPIVESFQFDIGQ